MQTDEEYWKKVVRIVEKKHKPDLKMLFESIGLSTMALYCYVRTIEKNFDKFKLGKDDKKILENMIKHVLSMMIVTDIDDVFLDYPDEMKEYDRMLNKYLGIKTPSHSVEEGEKEIKKVFERFEEVGIDK